MSTPADLDDRFARIDARLGAVEAELARWRGAAPAPYPVQAAAPHAVAPQPVPPQPGSRAAGPWAPPGYGPPPPGYGYGYPPARPVPPPRTPTDWSRVPVWAGGIVTVVGVLLLLVLAASAFGPLARVLTGAALGVALLALAGWLVRRSGRAGAGPSALAGTGTTALLGSVVAATALYRLAPAPVGLLLCLVIAAVGIALADRWDSVSFALAVLAGVEIALMATGGRLGPLSLAMAVVVALGVAPTALRRAAVLAPVAAAGTALHGVIAGTLAAVDPSAGDLPAELLLGVGVLALVAGVGIAVLGALRGSAAPAAVGIVLAPAALLAALPAAGAGLGAVAALVGAAVTAAALYPATGRVVRTTAVSVAALLVAAATLRWFDGVLLAGVLLAEALLLLGAAAWLRSRPVQLAGAWLAVVGGFAALGTALDPVAVLEPLDVPVDSLPVGPTPGALVVAGLLTVVAVTALVTALRTGVPSAANWIAWAWVPVAAGLYGASWLVVTGAQLVAPGENGFLAGHVLVTLGITGLGVVLLVRGLRRPAAARAGFALIVAALLKLVLFDLVTLDGLARVAAFIGAGLVLLAVGTWYARHAGPAAAAGPAGTDVPAAGDRP